LTARAGGSFGDEAAIRGCAALVIPGGGAGLILGGASYLAEMVRRLVVAGVLLAALVGCSDTGIASTPAASSGTPSVALSGTPVGKPAPPTRTPTARRTSVISLTVPAIGVRGLRVVAYAGTADDRPGTAIQNRGVAANPRGPGGGVGPGEVGNFIVTAHRTEHGRPFGRLPEVRNGDHVLVTYDGFVYDYQVVQTMTISFRKPAEKAAQNAAVPGRPGEPATQAMITLSTCATAEDHAQGNYWKDALNNPEHRIDKVARLTATRPVP
jgi:sortase A